MTAHRPVAPHPATRSAPGFAVRLTSRPTGRVASRRAARVAGEAGQASVELVILAPLFVAVVLAAAQLLAAGAAGELADHAAEAGAVALLQGDDPSAAARDAVPGWSRARMTVRVDGRRVRVRMRPPSPFPGLAGMLESSREADAGPEPR